MDSFTIFPDENLVVFFPTPCFDTDCALSYLNDLVAHPDFRPGLKELVDLSGVTEWGIDYHELKTISSYNQGNRQPRNLVERMVVLAPNELAYGYSRMYHAFTQDYHSLTIVRQWHDLPAALAIHESALARCYEAFQPQLNQCTG